MREPVLQPRHTSNYRQSHTKTKRTHHLQSINTFRWATTHHIDKSWTYIATNKEKQKTIMITTATNASCNPDEFPTTALSHLQVKALKSNNTSISTMRPHQRQRYKLKGINVHTIRELGRSLITALDKYNRTGKAGTARMRQHSTRFHNRESPLYKPYIFSKVQERSSRYVLPLGRHAHERKSIARILCDTNK